MLGKKVNGYRVNTEITLIIFKIELLLVILVSVRGDHLCHRHCVDVVFQNPKLYECENFYEFFVEHKKFIEPIRIYYSFFFGAGVEAHT